MTKQEFDAIVNDAVKNGADRAEAADYIRAGYKLGVDFGKAEKSAAKPKGGKKAK